MKKNLEHARVIAQLKRRAERRGDREAAIFLLQEFVNHADEFERAKSVPVADRLVIRFLARAIREVLEGKSLEIALCLEANEGRPAVPLERDLSIAVQVHAKYHELRNRAVESDGGAVSWAIKAVAEDLRKKEQEELDREAQKRGLEKSPRKAKAHPATVKAAWKRLGALKGVSALLAGQRISRKLKKDKQPL